MDLDGANVRPIVPPAVPSEMDMTFASASYSADGARIFFNMYTADASFGDPGCCQLYGSSNADGTGLQKFVPNSGDTWDGEPAVSPDGKWVAFWHNLADGSTHGESRSSATDGTGG